MLELVRTAGATISSGIISITFLQGVFPVVSAWITKKIFDLLGIYLGGTVGPNWELLAWFLFAYTGVAFISKLLAPISTYLNAELMRQLTVEIQSTVYGKINSFLGIAYFENPKLYDSLRLAQQGAQQSAGQILSVFTTPIRDMVTLISFLSILFIFSPLLVLLVVLAALPELYIYMKFGHQRFRLAQITSSSQRQQVFHSFILSTPPPAKEIRLFDLGEYLLNKVLENFRHIHTAERKQQQGELRGQLKSGVLSSLVTSFAFVVVIVEAFRGNLTLGDVTLYVSAVSATQAALLSLMMSIGRINESILNYSYYSDLLALPEPLLLAQDPLPMEPLKSRIELRHVSFRYSEDHSWILKDVNLVICAGQSLALVGPNGAGKTTLVKLLTRMYDPTEGQIVWDGVDIREYDPIEYRRRLGAVFQDFMHYDLTAQENIGLGDVNKIEDLERIKQAAKKAGIHKRIEQLPRGYQTYLSLMFGDGSPSVDLSGGEWQKIAMARMFMRDADLLILDEPTAALDAEAEYEVHKKFMELVSGRTSILISHRFSTVRMAEMIAVLEDGRITEYGSHQQLLSLGGTYAKLYTMQAEKYTS